MKTMVNICPKPSRWNEICERLLAVRAERDLPSPPIPLILGGWVATDDGEKASRWAETVDWAEQHGLADLVVVEPQDWYAVRKPSSHVLGRGTIGMAGVFWVASELARRDWFAFSTIRNQIGVDIIATKEAPGRTKFMKIRVKTTQYRSKYWLLAKERESIPHRESLVFVFVKPQSNSPFAPFEAFVVPSAQVYEQAHQSESGTLCWWLRDSETFRDGWDALDA